MGEGWIERIPVVSNSNAIVILVLNIIFPGLGTIILAFKSTKISIEHFLIGIVQFLLFFFFFVGILWSIWMSILVLQKTGKKEEIDIIQVQNSVLCGYPFNPINKKGSDSNNFQDHNHFDNINNFQIQIYLSKISIKRFNLQITNDFSYRDPQIV